MTITDLIEKITALLITVRHKDEPLEEHMINILSQYQKDVCELEIDVDWDKGAVFCLKLSPWYFRIRRLQFASQRPSNIAAI